MKRLYKLALCILILTTLPLCGLAAEDGDRPKIGLALSGGGARGISHVGVLKMLEELNIPVDYIAGTSMGAIVGGLYSAGFTADELETIIGEIDWLGVLGDKMPREELPYRQKSDALHPIKLGFDFKEGAILPKGIMAGKRLDILLRTLALPASTTTDFNELPIPFKAVAADIDTGEVVVLENGNLAEAMRASMSLPGIFPPIEIDGRTLVDGGILMNLPVEVVKQMGADIIIAVNIGTPMSKRDDLKSFIGITDQSRKIMTLRYYDEQVALLGADDLLIEPDLKDISNGDYTRGDELIATGYAESQRLTEELSRYSVDPETYQAVREQQKQRSKTDLEISFVEVDDPSQYSATKLRQYMQKPLERIFNFTAMGQEIFKASSRDDLESIDFSLVEKDGQHGLLMQPRKKDWTDSYLMLGLNVSDNFKGDSNVNLTADLTIPRINRFGGEWNGTMQIGREQRLFTEYYQPLDPYAWALFVAPNATYENHIINIYDGDDRIAEYKIRRAYGQLDFGLHMDRYGEFRVGWLQGASNANPHIGDPRLPKAENREGAYIIKFTLDQLDSPYIPRKGALLNLEYLSSSHKLYADDAYHRFMLNYVQPITYKKGTFIFRTKLGTAFSDPLPVYQQFSLGGFLNISGMRDGQLRDNHLLFTQLIYMHEAWNLKKGIIDEIYLGGSIENAGVWAKRSDIQIASNQMTWAGTFFMGTDTKLGPLYLGYGYADGGNHALYIHMGHVF